MTRTLGKMAVKKLKKRKRAKRGKIKTLKIKYSVTFVVFNEKKILYTY
jgi:hypothetical protein